MTRRCLFPGNKRYYKYLYWAKPEKYKKKKTGNSEYSDIQIPIFIRPFEYLLNIFGYSFLLKDIKGDKAKTQIWGRSGNFSGLRAHINKISRIL